MRKKMRYRKIANITWLLICAFLTICLIVGLRIAKTNGNSMKPLINDNQYIIYYSHFIKPKRGDVVLFERNETTYIKRIYGIPEDTVKITDGGLVLINGSPLVLKNLKIIGETGKKDMTDLLVLGEEEYFVLGDYRTISKDSRDSEIGTILRSEIVGILLLSP